MAASAQVPLCFAKILFNPTLVAFGMGSGGASSFCQGIKQTHPLKLQNILKRAWEPDTRGPEAPGWLWLYLQGHFDGRSWCGRAGSGTPALPHAAHSSTHLVLEGRDCNSTPKTSQICPEKPQKSGEESQLNQTNLILTWSSVITSSWSRGLQIPCLQEQGGKKRGWQPLHSQRKAWKRFLLHPRDWRNPTTGIPFCCQLAGDAVDWFCIHLLL